MKRQPTADEMLVKMAGLCAGAEQCSADIRGKVLGKGFSSEEADRIVGYLVKNRYIDDARFARAYAADKARFSGWGRIKIRMYLKHKGFSESLIREALDYIDENVYAESLQKALMSKARNLDLKEIGDRQKLYRHLASRGFESSLIVAAMRNFISNSNVSSD